MPSASHYIFTTSTEVHPARAVIHDPRSEDLECAERILGVNNVQWPNQCTAKCGEDFTDASHVSYAYCSWKS